MQGCTMGRHLLGRLETGGVFLLKKGADGGNIEIESGSEHALGT